MEQQQPRKPHVLSGAVVGAGSRAGIVAMAPGKEEWAGLTWSLS